MLSIVIPVHNRLVFTINCLNSIRQQTIGNLKVILVDDGSSDCTSEVVAKEYPEVHVLHGDGNLWWAGAVNLGIKFALSNGAKYVLLLNNDTILPSHFIEGMIHATKLLDDPILVPATVDSKTGEVLYSGELINWFLDSVRSIKIMNNPEFEQNLVEVTHCPGRGLLIPKSVFTEVGLFDSKSFPQYISDYDFTLRAAKMGFKLYCNHNTLLRVFPKESGTSSHRSKKSIAGYRRYLTAINSAANIRYFVKYALRHCPLYALIPFLTVGVSRRLFGYFFEWFREKYV